MMLYSTFVFYSAYLESEHHHLLIRLCNTDLINYRIDLDRKMSGWVSKGSAKEYSDEL